MDEGYCRCWLHWRVSGRGKLIVQGFVTMYSEAIFVIRQIEGNLGIHKKNEKANNEMKTDKAKQEIITPKFV